MNFSTVLQHPPLAVLALSVCSQLCVALENEVMLTAATPVIPEVNWFWTGTPKGGVYHLTSDSDQPALYVDKQITNVKSVKSWDVGTAFNATVRTAGDGNSVTVTDYAEVDYTCVACTGAAIATHSRVRLMAPGATGWGAWIYADVAEGFTSAYGAELNVKNRGPDTGWMFNVTTGNLIGLNVATADWSYDGIQSGIGTQAYRASKNTGKGWHSGFVVAPNSIVAADTNGNNEGIRVVGSTTSAGKYGGVVIGSKDDIAQAPNYLTFGIRTSEATFSQGAIELGSNQRIAWGGSKTTGGTTSVSANPAGLIVLQGLGVKLPVLDAPFNGAEEGTLIYVRNNGLMLYTGHTWVNL